MTCGSERAAGARRNRAPAARRPRRARPAQRGRWASLNQRKVMDLARTSRAALACALLCASILGCRSLPQQGETAAAKLTLVGVLPSPRTPITRDSIVVADLTYAAGDFVSGEYFILAQVETKDKDVTTDGDFPSNLYPILTAPSGQIHFSFPVKYVWDDSTIKHPLVVWFYLTKKIDPTSRLVVARAGPIRYRSPSAKSAK